MIRTSFFNVGHGEAIFIELIDKDLYGIVRDLGRSRFAKHTDFSMSLNRLLHSDFCECYHPLYYYLRHTKKLDAVLSHAHEDHFNGFKMLYDNKERDIFQNGYIPWLRMVDLDSLGGLLIKYSLLLYKYFGGDHPIAQNAKNWLLAAPIMAAISKNLWCVSAGHQVRHWPKANKILWPPTCLNRVEYEDNLRRNWKRYLFANKLESGFLEKEAKKILRVLRNYYSETDDKREERAFSSEESSKAIKTILRQLSKDLSEKETSKLDSPARLNTYAYKPTIDNHSLIFEIGDKRDQSLFLSDADDKTVKAMLNINKLSDKQYSLIKSGHHGNRGAKPLNEEIITSCYVVNCCGPAHSNWKGPDINYEKISKNLLCTDWNEGNRKWKYKDKYNISNACCIRK